MEKLKIAILGTGTIASKLAKAMKITPNAYLYAVASRDINKAAAFAQKYDIPNAYGSYEDAINDKEVSLVYIALPHPFHYKVSKMCLNAGKNVLCEKPLTVNALEAEELFSLASKKNLFFSEAMWTRFLPAVKTVTDLLNSGCIGNIKSLTAVIAHNHMGTPRMTDPNLAGGMLLDCGIYLITSAILLFGNDITDISTSAVLSPQGVDLKSSTELVYSSGKTASLHMAMDSEGDNKITVLGDKGYMEIGIVYNWQNIKIHTGEGINEISIPPQKAGGFEYMVESVCKAVLQGEKYCSILTPSDTIYVMRLMDTLREKWHLKYPFE